MRYLSVPGRLLLRHRHVLLGILGVVALGAVIAWISARVHAQKDVNEGTADAFIPVEAPILVQIRVADLAASDFGKLLAEATPQLDPLRIDRYGKPGPKTWNELFEQTLAVPADQIESLVLAQARGTDVFEMITMRPLERHLAGRGPFRVGPRATYFGTGTPREIPYPTPTALPPQTGKGTPIGPGTGTGHGRPAEDVFSALSRQPLIVLQVKQQKALDKALALAAENSERRVHHGMTYYASRDFDEVGVLFLSNRAMVLGPVSLIERGIDAHKGKAKDHPRLEALRKNTAKHIWIDVVRGGGSRPERDDFAAMAELVGQLQPLGATRVKQLSLHVGRDAAFESRWQFATAADAEKAVRAVRDYMHITRLLEAGVLMAALQREGDQAFEQQHEEALLAMRFWMDRFEDVLREPVVKQDDKAVTVSVKATIDVPALQAAARDVVRKTWSDETKAHPKRLVHSRMNLRQLGRGLGQFDMRHGTLPPVAICDKDGIPLLSWRVAILPYIGETALYEQFKLNEPWDSDHNKKLIAKMPRVFEAPGLKPKEPGWTNYQAVVGKGTAWELLTDADKPLGARGWPYNAKLRYDRFTLAIAEAAEPVVWTRPRDMPFEAGKTLPKLGGVFKGKANLLLFNQQALTLRLPLSDADLQNLCLRAATARPSEDFWDRIERLANDPYGPDPRFPAMTGK
jgi:hypothetical protein